jgi:hypothetical protein
MMSPMPEAPLLTVGSLRVLGEPWAGAEAGQLYHFEGDGAGS